MHCGNNICNCNNNKFGDMLNRKNYLIQSVLLGLSVGTVFLIAKNRKSIFRNIQNLWRYKDQLRNQEVEIVNTVEECEKLVNTLKIHCAEYNVLGFDCEWITVGGRRRPIALLQLTSHKGLCGLIRLCNLRQVPSVLKTLLEDEHIIKVGVAPIDDARYLAHDYAIEVMSTLDLRYLSVNSGGRPDSLAKLAKTYLGIELDKNWRIRCSDWESPELTEKQKKYAANDSHVSIEIFKILSKKISSNWFFNKSMDIIDSHKLYLNRPFNANKNSKIDSTGNKIKIQPSTKVFKRGLSTRSKPLYDNCYLQDPDGEILCTMEKRKANWYLEKNLGIKVSDDPITVRLNFEPRGKAVGETGDYYRLEKQNMCVVCGRKDKFIRKNVIPRDYRRYFPEILKDHTSHDVLLLCPECHQNSNLFDLIMREQLVNLCNAPIAAKDGGHRSMEDPVLKRLRSQAKALLFNFDKIPEERRLKLSKDILNHFKDENEISNELLKQIVEIDITVSNENYQPHGHRVVEYFKSYNNGGLFELEKMWREHFLKTMHPKYLPKLWSINHNIQRLSVRADEKRLQIDELEAIGLDFNKFEQLRQHNVIY